MKPSEGRSRVVIEDVRPQIDGGRFPIKRVIGDTVQITAAVFGDGHDHVAAQLLYRHSSERDWRVVAMSPLGNDLWTASIELDNIGEWTYTVRGWVDHFDTWVSDLQKRIDTQPHDVYQDDAQSDDEILRSRWKLMQELRRDIPLAFRTGAEMLDRASTSARNIDAKELKSLASHLRWQADLQQARYENPLTAEHIEMISRYPDHRYATLAHPELKLWVDRELARFSSWYEFFPRSSGAPGTHGKLRDAAKLFPGIAAMGFDIVYFPPIHPIGNAFRKGKNNTVVAEAGDVGSPWAIGSKDGGHTSIAPELGTLIDFDATVAEAKACGLELALDIAFQCSPDHPWVAQHPEWFIIRPDGSIQYAENPPKKYQDIYPLNFESSDWRGLWQELANVFLFWAKRGVRVFRVDNPHTKALPFWEWCITEVHRTYPDAIFLAEAFTRPHVMYGLAKRGFGQSYTYFTWRTNKQELTAYAEEVSQPPVADFFRPNFWPNTPDILPPILQTGERGAFEQRVVLASMLSANYGVYGPAFELFEHEPMRPGSEEYLHSEKYQLREWDRTRADSLMPLLGKLNWIRRNHPALQKNDSLRFHEVDNPNLICFSKHQDDDILLIVVNMNPAEAEQGWTDLNLEEFGLKHTEAFDAHDLLRDETYRWQGAHNYVRLDPLDLPAHVLHIRRISLETNNAAEERA